MTLETLLHARNISTFPTIEETFNLWQSIYSTQYEVLYHLKILQRIFDHLNLYQDSSLESTPLLSICWKDGRRYQFEWARTMNGDPGYFKELGYKNYQEFYDLTQAKRENFLSQGILLFKQIFLEKINLEGSVDEFLLNVKSFHKSLHDLATDTLN
ncbi:hypothetical protein NEF87_001892 [Candidatus Lokiarchaeum ossiferum]|uniref:Uncharacterized protein n=1 Tax=Candidatus Lokiarchaeum ossiferum TaxID=2951803 RepID=A0ABY6HTA1_9ARCH|nr:hypothetical protein NEF87_001892 [Candidatus Lokiarchaeum sp. B-35]